ncbi:MAG: sigma-70 family RNA polymerase sigma factor [Planctomycetota bacterium]
MKLFLRNESVLRAYARTMLPDLDSVDDALQDAYLTMYEKFSQLRDEAGFLPWGKVIVRFKCLSLATKLRKSRPVLGDDVLASIADVAEQSGSEELSELRRAFDQCYAKFSASQRNLLLAPYSGQGRVTKLAVEVGKSDNAVYMMLVRLRAKLGRCVRKRLQEAGG